MTPEMLAQMELQRKKTQFLADQEIAMLVEPSTQGDGGTFFVQSASIPGASPFGGGGGGRDRAPRVTVYSKDAPKIVPQVVLAKEHYNRLVRMCEAGEKRQDRRRTESRVPRPGLDVVQHRRRDSRHRSEARAGDAGRPHGFLAQRHRRNRQRRRRIRRHGSGAHPQGTRLEAAANHPDRTLER